MLDTIPARHRVSVYLAGEFYCSRKEVLAHATQMLEKYALGDELRGDDYRFARDLLEKHPRAPFVFGCGLKAITVYQPAQGRGRKPNKSLRIVRVDGSVALCGFRDVIFGREQGKEEFLSAGRCAIEGQIELFSRRAFKSSLSRIWCGEEKTWIHYRDHAVTYWGKTFEELVDQYVESTQLNLGGIRYYRPDEREGVLLFAEPDDKREWQNWHRRHAQLRIVKKSRDLREMTA